MIKRIFRAAQTALLILLALGTSWGTLSAAPDKTYTPPPTIFVRPGGISYRWNFGTGTTPDPNYPGTYPVTSVGYYNVPAFNWVVTRGHFEYTSNGGTSWTTYTMGTSPVYISNSGVLWRFVDTSPSDTTNNNSFGTSWNLQGPTSSVQSGGSIIPDNPPTDITSDKLVILSAAGPGAAVATLTPTDTGSTVGGYWAIDSQSVSGLFTLTNNSTTGNTATLLLGSGTLPAIGNTASVTVHYYDLYQTDTNGAPLAGDGFSKTLTFTVVAEATSDLNFTSDLAVNTYTNNDQSHPATATLSTGNFVVVWESAGQDGKDLTPNVNHGIYGQLYSATGSKVGGEFVISSSGHAVDEIEPVVTPLNDGRFAVAYRTAGADYDIAFRIVETNGTVSAQHIANTTTAQNQYNPGIATLTDGSFVIVWGSDDAGIRLQQFSSTNGSAIGSEITINTNGYSPAVAGLSNGSYAVSWADGNTYDIMAQVGAAGSPVDTGVAWAGYSIAARIAPLASGFVVAMEAYDSGTGTAQIEAARFNNSATLQGSVFTVATHTGGNRYGMAVAKLSGGGFVITWNSDIDDYDNRGIFGRRFAADGTAVDNADFEVNEHRTGDQSAPVVTGLAGNLFAAAWTDIPDASILDSSYIGDVEARVLLPSNTAPTPNVNAGLTLNEGALGNLSATVLDFNDAEQADTAITYTLNTAPANGQLLLNGVALAVNGTFTQDDLDNSRLQYAHDGSDTTSDSFTFTVSDGAGGSVSGQSFNFTVTPVNDAAALASAPTITFTSAPGG
ncbi:MAG TPA: cadherin-like domain-containing protein, partial [Dongiaceae bacterium]|nr:cadherin-like domain-containing protein [Dongiaceae bacterium]